MDKLDKDKLVICEDAVLCEDKYCEHRFPHIKGRYCHSYCEGILTSCIKCE